MQFSGQIRKMSSQLGPQIQYYLNLTHEIIGMNQLIGRQLKISQQGYQCLSCNSPEAIFRMGFCKKCFYESPMANDSILRPELSTAHLGIEQRDLAYEQALELQPHVVYLADTGGTKVGVTRESQIPTRWIDQGATQALVIARTQNRYEAGMIEVALKAYLADKTNWRKMLQQSKPEADLLHTRSQVLPLIPADFQSFVSPDEAVLQLNFPYPTPEKINSFSLDKQAEFEGKLLGIKGQYLLFEGGSVINLRSHEGYVVELEILG
jgi:Protein of unknown function (DUF2797)